MVLTLNFFLSTVCPFRAYRKTILMVEEDVTDIR